VELVEEEALSQEPLGHYEKINKFQLKKYDSKIERSS